MNKLKVKKVRFTRKRLRVKNKLRSDKTKLRLCISRSNKNFFAQIIDDVKGHTLVSFSTLSKEFPEMKSKGNVEAAKELGKIIAEKAKSQDIKSVVFDRNGFLYHGKIKAFADSARENGLEF